MRCMGSLGVVIAAPRGRGHVPLCSVTALFPLFTIRSSCSRWTDLRVHDAPIFVFTSRRSSRSPSSEIRRPPSRSSCARSGDPAVSVAARAPRTGRSDQIQRAHQLDERAEARRSCCALENADEQPLDADALRQLSLGPAHAQAVRPDVGPDGPDATQRLLHVALGHRSGVPRAIE